MTDIPLKKKKIWQTKTFYVGLLVIAKGGIEGFVDGNWDAAAQSLLAGLAIITGRDALLEVAGKR